jgi:hypothetical protein
MTSLLLERALAKLERFGVALLIGGVVLIRH